LKKEKTYFGFGRNVFFTGLVSFFMDVSSEMIYPLVPLFLANVLGVNMAMIGLIEGIAESTASLLKVFSGWFSDWTRQRKNLMLAGYAISTLSRPIMAMAGAWQQVLASRFTDRLGKGIRTAPRDAIIAEATQSTHLGRAFSFHRAMDTMGAVVGPAITFSLLGFFNTRYTTGIVSTGIPTCSARRIRKASLELPRANRVAITMKNFTLQSKWLRLNLGRSASGCGCLFFSWMKRIIRMTAITPGTMESQKILR